MMLLCLFLCLGGSVFVSSFYKYSSLNKRQVNKTFPNELSESKCLSDPRWVSDPTWGWFVVLD